MDRAVRLTIVGGVQGVGYRDWAVKMGRRLGLRGWVRNRRNGSVEAHVAGEEAAVARMIEACRRGPPLAQVDQVDEAAADVTDLPPDFARLPTL